MTANRDGWFYFSIHLTLMNAMCCDNIGTRHCDVDERLNSL